MSAVCIRALNTPLKAFKAPLKVQTRLFLTADSPLSPFSPISTTSPAFSLPKSRDCPGKSPFNNCPPSIVSKIGSNLHLRPGHPLNTIKAIISDHFKNTDGFTTFDNFSPIVPTYNNFDSLLIPSDHPGRQPSDTYYIDETTVLRTHTSAHQLHLMASSNSKFLVIGDCYRRDEIDYCHYPVFHQCEGVKLFPLDSATEDEVIADLKSSCEGLMGKLFGNDIEFRWGADYFPFTNPSFELEVKYNGEWLEVAGSGVVKEEIVKNSLVGGEEEVPRKGWAFGLGLERLAMILFEIPDIRLFWSEDIRFHSQFSGKNEGKIVKFTPYSKYPLCYKDVSFWLNKSGEETKFNFNEFCDLIREQCDGDYVEKIELIDEFENKIGRKSQCYRITYRSMDRSLTNEEVDVVQFAVRDKLARVFDVELR